MKASIEVATGQKFKILKPYYLKKIFGGWDKSWKLLIPGSRSASASTNSATTGSSPRSPSPSSSSCAAGYHVLMAATGNDMASMAEESCRPAVVALDFWGSS